MLVMSVGCSLTTVASKLAMYKLDLVAVHEIRWNNAGSEPADGYTFFYGNANHHLKRQASLYIR